MPLLACSRQLNDPDLPLDPQRQRKAKEYARIRHRLLLVDLALALGGALALLFALSRPLTALIERITTEPWLEVLLYMAVVSRWSWQSSCSASSPCPWGMPTPAGVPAQARAAGGPIHPAGQGQPPGLQQGYAQAGGSEPGGDGSRAVGGVAAVLPSAHWGAGDHG